MTEKIKYRGYKIKIEQDQYCENPNSMGDTSLSFLVYDHRQFCIQVDGCDPNDVFNAMQQNNETVDFYNKYSKKYNQYRFYPVFAYIHSGVSLSLANSQYPFTCQWDVSFKGFCLVSTVEFPNKTDARKCAEATIEEWNHYLSGNVWGFDIPKTGDSCWGFVGDKEYCISEAKSSIDCHINYKNKQKVEKHLFKLKAWIQNQVPIQYRTPCKLA